LSSESSEHRRGNKREMDPEDGEVTLGNLSARPLEAEKMGKIFGEDETTQQQPEIRKVEWLGRG